VGLKRGLVRLGRESRLARGLYQGLRLAALYLRALPSLLGFLGHRLRGLRAMARTPDERPHVLFVAWFPRIRELKLAHAARRQGYRVTLLAKNVPWREEIETAFDHYRPVRDCWQVLTEIDRCRPDVVHLFAANNNAELAPIVAFSTAPVVVDPYDCAQGFIQPRYQYAGVEVAAERYNLERAAHLCCRSLEPRFLRRQYGYRLPETTFFPDYCWRDPAQPSQHPAASPHVVYCGSVVPEDRVSPREFGYAQYLEIGRALAAAGVHFHLYPAKAPFHGDPREYFSLYLRETEENEYFHFHMSIPPEQLRRRLAEYDAALHILGPGIHEIRGRITAAKVDQSTANKVFDYLEAGLPVIIHRGRLQRALVRHYGQAIEIDRLEEIPAALRSLRPKLAHSRPTLAAHAHRLERMYRRVVANTIRSGPEETAS
jgi:hypothetical protein